MKSSQQSTRQWLICSSLPSSQCHRHSHVHHLPLFPSNTWLQPRWLPCYSTGSPSLLPSQGLSTCYPFCPESLSPRLLHSLLGYVLQAFFQALPFSECSLNNKFKLVVTALPQAPMILLISYVPALPYVITTSIGNIVYIFNLMIPLIKM